jgi:GNAT superfamily N-acetyltransferase
VTADPVIREARSNDAEGFVRAHEVAWNATIGHIVGSSLDVLMPFPARVESYSSSIGQASDRARAWVAEVADEIVGIAVALRESPGSVELRDLYVVPSAWGTGIARALMSAALDSVAADADDAFLWVGEANARARCFYEREGWAEVGDSRASQLGPVELRYRRRLHE